VWRHLNAALVFAACLAACMTTQRAGAPAVDSLSWLDEITGERALAWVRDQNARTARQLTQSALFQRNYERARAVHLDREPVPLAGPSMLHEGWVYDLLVDASHPRGLWRRIELRSLLAGFADWQPLIDVTALAASEGHPISMVLPVDCFKQRCLISLEGTAERSASLREFDLETREFVKNGFNFAPRNWAIWKDSDTLLIAGDFGPETVSARQLPTTLREWRRGQSPTMEIFRGQGGGTNGVQPLDLPNTDGERFLIFYSMEAEDRSRSFFVGADGRVIPTLLPHGVGIIGLYRGQVLVLNTSKETWTAANMVVEPGSLVSMPLEEIGRAAPNVRVILEPRERELVMWFDVALTNAGLLVTTYLNVRPRVSRFDFDGARWHRHEIPFPDQGSVTLVASDPSSATALLSHQDFLRPPTLYAVNAASGESRVVLNARADFDVAGLITEQNEAVSKDGTRVPYSIVRSATDEPKGQTPTILYGYGAAGGVRTPHYDGALGRLWLEDGGAFVLANVRGGSELGPAWHVRRMERQRTYEDFIAVAEDLIRRKLTSPRHLAIRGHSNGGLLVGVALNMRPDLFNAAVMEHPVLDLRLHTRGIDTDDYGAWSNPGERAYLERQSPLQNLREQRPFPTPLIKTATDDDVLPSQARRYAATLASFGIPFYYFESAGGRHALGDTPQDVAYYDALLYTYLAERLR
jgi:prolyl oligopeptidase